MTAVRFLSKRCGFNLVVNVKPLSNYTHDSVEKECCTTMPLHPHDSRNPAPCSNYVTDLGQGAGESSGHSIVSTHISVYRCE
jgi:hypothetical protein